MADLTDTVDEVVRRLRDAAEKEDADVVDEILSGLLMRALAAEAEAAKLRAERDEAMEVMRPFAAAALEAWNPNYPYINNAHCRRANAFLAKHGGQDNG